MSFATAEAAGIRMEIGDAEQVAQRLEQDKGAAARVLPPEDVEVQGTGAATGAEDEPFPAELLPVSEEEFDVLQSAYTEVKERCVENMLPAPNPPLNPEQRALCRKALVVLRMMKRLRARGLSRQAYSEQVA